VQLQLSLDRLRR